MRRLVVVGLALGAVACGPPAKLSEVEAEVFKKSCAFATCHTGSSAAGGLHLDGRTFDQLVNAQADSKQVLVVPGKPDQSFLMTKLNGAMGNPVMPPDAPLEPSRLEMVRAWIAAGAKDD